MNTPSNGRIDWLVWFARKAEWVGPLFLTIGLLGLGFVGYWLGNEARKTSAQVEVNRQIIEKNTERIEKRLPSWLKGDDE